MGTLASHRELIVWQKAISLAEQAYGLARSLPRHERYGLTSQLTRASVSVATNIAKGYYRSSREYCHFLAIAKGSVMEMETLLLIACRLEYLSEAETHATLELIIEISKMLTAIRARLP